MLRKPPPLTASKPGDADHLSQVTIATFLADVQNAGQYSLYRVSTIDELRWATTGLLSGRNASDKLLQNINFFWITPEELTNTGVSATQTLGDTVCGSANALHYEWPAAEEHARKVCESLIAADLTKRIVELRKPDLRAWLIKTKADRCRAHDPKDACLAHYCAPDRS
jgi:hypothetical protein